MNEFVIVLSDTALEKRKQSMCRPYRYLGDYHAWETEKAFKNYLFFTDNEIISQSEPEDWGYRLRLKNNFPKTTVNHICRPRDEYEKIPMDFEMLKLGNGSYRLEKRHEGIIYSKHSIYKDNTEIIDYAHAEAILNKIDFQGFVENYESKQEEIRVVDFRKGLVAVVSNVFTVDANDLTIADKKEFIRQYYKEKLSNTVIMHNSGSFFLMKQAEKE